MGLWRTLEVPDWSFASWYLLWYRHRYLVEPYSKFWSTSWFWRCKEHPCTLSHHLGLWRTLEVPDLGLASWSCFWIWSMVFDAPMIWILDLYLQFEGAKNIQVIIWGFGGHWRLLTGVWHLNVDLGMVTGLWYTHDPNFSSLSWFWRCKEHPCP